MTAPSCELVAGYDTAGGKAEDRICGQPAVAKWLSQHVCADCLALIETELPPGPDEVERLPEAGSGP